MPQDVDLGKLIRQLKEKYAPDKRIEIFDIEVQKCAGSIVIKGETSSEEGYAQLMSLAYETALPIEIDVRLLPDSTLEGKEWGIVYNSVGTMRTEPRYGAELSSQVLLGMPVRILDRQGEWSRIQAPDKYIGWIHGSVKAFTKTELLQYLKKPKVIVTAMVSHSQEKPLADSFPVSDLVIGDMLALKAEVDDYCHVVYPDGREGYIPKSDVMEMEHWLQTREMTGERIVHTSRRFMGIPYLWGGTSSKGMDCSGFTKMVYFLQGVILPRDASQQVACGRLIDSAGDLSNAQAGDLLFFGAKADEKNPSERVVHVGIYLGENRFIHASDYIRIGSFDPTDPLYDNYNRNRYLRTKRIIGEVNTSGIEEIFENKFYKQ